MKTKICPISERTARERLHGRSITILAPEKPKPTGEWTSDELVECVNGVGYKELARRINAELDAEREIRQEAERSLAVAVGCLEWLREELKNDDYYVEKIDIAFTRSSGNREDRQIVLG